jgi:hypothetical protein
VFTRALHWSLSWARSIQSIPSHPISLKSILILPARLRIGLSSGLFPFDFHTNILHSFLISPFVLHALLILLHRNKLIFYGELLAPRPIPKLENHPLSTDRDCLFSTFAVTLHTWKASPTSTTWGRAMPWWQGTYLIWMYILNTLINCLLSFKVFHISFRNNQWKNKSKFSAFFKYNNLYSFGFEIQKMACIFSYSYDLLVRNTWVHYYSSWDFVNTNIIRDVSYIDVNKQTLWMCKHS